MMIFIFRETAKQSSFKPIIRHFRTTDISKGYSKTHISTPVNLLLTLYNMCLKCITPRYLRRVHFFLQNSFIQSNNKAMTIIRRPVHISVAWREKEREREREKERQGERERERDTVLANHIRA
jgi:hypothetical protein